MFIGFIIGYVVHIILTLGQINLATVKLRELSTMDVQHVTFILARGAFKQTYTGVKLQSRNSPAKIKNILHAIPLVLVAFIFFFRDFFIQQAFAEFYRGWVTFQTVIVKLKIY